MRVDAETRNDKPGAKRRNCVAGLPSERPGRAGERQAARDARRENERYEVEATRWLRNAIRVDRPLIRAPGVNVRSGPQAGPVLVRAYVTSLAPTRSDRAQDTSRRHRPSLASKCPTPTVATSATTAAEADFDPRVLDRTVIARPLLERARRTGDDAIFDVVIDLNLNFPGGRDRARERVRDLVSAAMAATGAEQPEIGVDDRKTDLSDQYVFARLDRRRDSRASCDSTRSRWRIDGRRSA